MNITTNVTRLASVPVYGYVLLAILLAAGLNEAASGESPEVQHETQKLLAPDGASGDHLGVGVAIDGNVAVVGAHEAAGGAGAAYVYVWNGTQWLAQATLTASDGQPGDQFGHVDVDGEVILVGAQLDDDLGYHSGSAYVFRWSGSIWVEEAKLLSPDGGSYEGFGRRVAIRDNVAVVAAQYVHSNAAGAVYVFRKVGQTWTHEATLTEPDANFGDSMNMSGDVIVVGAPSAWPVGDPGVAHVYRRTGTQWLHEARLVAPDGRPNDYFGAVSIDGGVIVVGASGADAAYVFEWNGSEWVPTDQLRPYPEDEGDEFGSDTAVDGNAIVVSVVEGDQNGDGSGHAYAYLWNGVAWIESALLVPSDGAAGDLASWHGIGLQDGRALLTSWGDDNENGVDAGAAYVFDGVGVPLNDSCANAISISEGATSFSNINATTDGPTLPLGCAEGGQLGFGADIWFTYSPERTGTVTISTCGQADFDTRLAAYAGSCGNLIIGACNDDAPGCGQGSEMTISTMTASETALIRVGGYQAPTGQVSTGSGTLTIQLDPCPDFNGDGSVGFADLSRLLAFWGDCPGCEYDMNEDGRVGFADLTSLLNAWGPC